jgi:hypothetical protein
VGGPLFVCSHSGLQMQPGDHVRCFESTVKDSVLEELTVGLGIWGYAKVILALLEYRKDIASNALTLRGGRQACFCAPWK